MRIDIVCWVLILAIFAISLFIVGRKMYSLGVAHERSKNQQKMHELYKELEKTIAENESSTKKSQ